MPGSSSVSAGYQQKRMVARRPTPHPNRLRPPWPSNNCCALLLVGALALSAWMTINPDLGMGNHMSKITVHHTNQVNYASVPKQETVVNNSQSHSTNQRKWPKETGVALTSLLKRASRFVQNDQIEETEFYWQLPPDTLKPQGILFLAHGCSHSGSDWWPNDPNTCPGCLGLPEERAIVQLAHSSQFRMATVALSSGDRIRKCWSTSDGPRVARVLKYFQSLFPNVPTYAFGASSGGGFVSSRLPLAMAKESVPLAGYISEIMSPDPNSQLSGAGAPASVFITMPKDIITREQVSIFVEKQTGGGKNSKHIQVKEHGISSTFFHQRIPSISPQLSQKLAEALKKARLLNDSTLELLADPRREMEWKAALRPVLVANPSYNDDFVPDRSPISEVMNVAYGEHEMTVDGVAEALGWLASLQRKSKQ